MLELPKPAPWLARVLIVLQQAIRDSRARLFIHLSCHLSRLGAALSTACGELGR